MRIRLMNEGSPKLTLILYGISAPMVWSYSLRIYYIPSSNTYMKGPIMEGILWWTILGHIWRVLICKVPFRGSLKPIRYVLKTILRACTPRKEYNIKGYGHLGTCRCILDKCLKQKGISNSVQTRFCGHFSGMGRGIFTRIEKVTEVVKLFFLYF